MNPLFLLVLVLVMGGTAYTETVHANGKHFAKYSMRTATPDAYKVQRVMEMSA